MMRIPKSRRILMLLQNCPYPTDRRVRKEALTLSSAGFRVMVISPSFRGLPPRETLDGVQVYRFAAPKPASNALGYVWEYGRSLLATFMLSLSIFLAEGFDVVHAHQPPDAYWLIAGFYKLFGVRYVMDHHDLSPELFRARFRGRGNRGILFILRWLEKRACRAADRLIATNDSYKMIEMERGGAPEWRIAIVRNAPSLDDLVPDTSSPEAVRPSPSITIGYVGVTGIQDGVENLLKALRSLKEDLGKTGFRCVIVGSGEALNGLKALAKSLGLASLVSFTGWIERPADVARWMSGMDICIAPEPEDPYNIRSTAIKVMEYMAFGKPVVAFDLPEHRFSAGDAALYARPGDVKDMARQIAALMADAMLRRELGRKGRERIETELNWGREARNLLAMYETLWPLGK